MVKDEGCSRNSQGPKIFNVTKRMEREEWTLKHVRIFTVEGCGVKVTEVSTMN